ncbi:MAG TPA: TonB-dependent receptor plug domain-containing protein [Opitutaceae bacterium]|nr:TonB-dependent receptor plug domain-containing protein [Opitutaceae bacterium]
MTTCVSRKARSNRVRATLFFVAASLPGGGSLHGQANLPDSAGADTDEVIVLSPFEVSADRDTGYQATDTLAGTRLRSDLKDVGSAISVLTKEFLQDIGATDNMSALSYATNMEVGGLTGNFQNAPNTGSFALTAEENNRFNPNSNTRVRGLVGADNTRNYFRTNVAWDGYNVSRIDILRGPNSILFGLGSPGGVVNATTDSAELVRDRGQVSFTTDEFGSFRATADYNKVLIKSELALRIALLSEQEEFKQEPAEDDENRMFLATKYRPSFLNRNGMSFEVAVDFERGYGSANRPRTAPPHDYITGWVEPVSTQPIQLPAGTNFMGFPGGLIPAYTQFADQAGITFLQNVGRTFGPEFQLWADAFGPRLNVNSLASSEDYWRQGRVWVEGVRLTNGNTYFGNPQTSRRLFGYGNAFQDTPLRNLRDYVIAQNHPLGSFFVPPHLTDPTVFDFYHKLLDGPNKEEWNDFDQLRVVLANTFFNQKLGYELSYFHENVTRGQTTYLPGGARIFVDTQLETIEGLPNPDFGRPYVQETTFSGNRIRENEVEGFRASAFGELNFNNNERDDSWWRRVLGRHIFNAAYSEDESFEDTRNFQRHVLGPEFVEKSPNNPLFNNRTRVSVRNYLGDSLAGRTSISGANINNLDRYVIPAGGTIDLRWFDTMWNAPASVNPAGAWVNPLGQNWDQAANPANYVGWTNDDYTITDALSGDPADLDAATRDAAMTRNIVESTALTWQGHLFDGLIVGTFGWREDKSVSDRISTQTNPEPYNSAIVDPEFYNLDPANPRLVSNSFVVRSKNNSAVVHLNKLPWVGKELPLNVSLSYNEGENFNPTTSRRDVNGGFLPQPQGSTEEYGVLISTKDNRYSLRVFKYETGVLYSNSVQIPNANFRLAQFFTPDVLQDIEEGIMRSNYEALVTPPTWSIDDQENIHAPAWRQFEQALVAQFPGFVPSWLTAGTWPATRQTALSMGFANTEDNVSKGWEIEFTANPTRQLRLTVNASKANATRTNVPGNSTRSLYEFIQGQIVNPDGTPTAAGLMRGADWENDTMADVWYDQNWIDYGVNQQLNGQPAPELVEWRANALANYTFSEGSLRGFGVGGAYRYEGSSTIGFPYYFDADGVVTLDVDRPFKRGSNGRFDIWFRYGRRLHDNKVDWSIQLNVSNLFGDDELIPVRANPDGTAANFRIQQGMSWRLTNTFRF